LNSSKHPQLPDCARPERYKMVFEWNYTRCHRTPKNAVYWPGNHKRIYHIGFNYHEIKKQLNIQGLKGDKWGQPTTC